MHLHLRRLRRVTTTANALGDIKTVRAAGRSVNRTFTESSLRESTPNLTDVLTAGERLVRIDNRIAGRDEGGVARLQRHTVHDNLHGEVLAITRDAFAVKLRKPVVILAVLVDEVPEDLVEHRRPDVADGVDFLVEISVGVDLWVLVEVGRVEVVSDAKGAAANPVAHGVVGLAGVAGLEADGGGVEIAPTFAHAAGFEQGEATGVQGSTSETVGEAVGVLVDNNSGIEAAVAVGGCRVPDVHAHACWLAVRRCGEVGVVLAGTILSVEVDEILTGTTCTIVVDLEVSGLFVET